MVETEKTRFTTSSLRAYIMIAVLAGIWLYFHWATNSIFMTPRNLSNLATQMSVTGILAVGMLMLIVSGNIDLSVGSVLGFAGGIAAYSMSIHGDGKVNYVLLLLNVAIPIVGIVAFIWVMNGYQGVPIPVLIFVSVALIGVFLTTSTVFGRYLYAIGGNPDAARLSGINNKRNILKVYALLGAFTGIAALIFTARVGSAAPDAGTLKELDAIAACVIGGASLMGGRGTVFGACIGALIMASLDNGMSLLNVRDFMQDIVKGSILVAAVGLDMMGRKQT